MNEILLGRKKRSEERKKFIKNNKNAKSYITLTINMPGKIKNNKFTKNLFYEALKEIYKKLNKNYYTILNKKIFTNDAGPVFLAALNIDQISLKKMMVKIENKHTFGRLFDIDVYNKNNRAMSRKKMDIKQRRCLLCEHPAKECIRENRHDKSDLEEKISYYKEIYKQNYTNYEEEKAEQVKNLAFISTLREIFTTPKPGLIDLWNNGSHDDMNLDIFIKSTNAIKPYFKNFFLIGYENYFNKNNIFNDLRKLGKKAEKSMFSATGGINTQKGIVFSFGLILGSLGYLTAKGDLNSNKNLSNEISELVQNWTAGIVYRELESKLKIIINGENFLDKNYELTHGQKIFLKYNISGARGEAESGFKNVLINSLPVMKISYQNSSDLNYASIQSLITLLANVDDSNILYRSDLKTLKKIKKRAKKIKNVGGWNSNLGKKKYNKLIKFIQKKGISPGGSADLLAVTHLLYLIDTKYSLLK